MPSSGFLKIISKLATWPFSADGNVALLEAVKHGVLLLAETMLQVELRPQVQL